MENQSEQSEYREQRTANIDLSDPIGAEGELFITKTGEQVLSGSETIRDVSLFPQFKQRSV